MNNYMVSILAFIAALGSGLMAGIFFAFSVFIMNALSKLTPSNGIMAMQQINKTIITPLFLILFLGTALVSLILIITGIIQVIDNGLWMLLTGGILYFIGSFVITIVFNIPMNDRLAIADSRDQKSLKLWTDYLSRWTTWNHVRTIAAIAATIAFTVYLSS